MSKLSHPDRPESRWPHRWAVMLCVATFPLIWVGGLVTTYDAGMAVPDWPSTYGYNLLLYPWATWVSGPWDLFIEHGHRLLGAFVGLLAIGLVISSWVSGGRRWLRWSSLVALVLVIVQGSLGGARVLLDDRLLAMLHGCVGPAFFAFSAALAVCTSTRWRQAKPIDFETGAGKVQRLACLTAALAYLQLIVGAQLRHVPAMASASVFRWMVIFHLLLAAVLVLHVVLLAVATWRASSFGSLRSLSGVLAALILVQVLLGGGTWIVKYGVPTFLADSAILSGFTVQAKSFWQAMLVTGHVATGSLILATSVSLSLLSFRCVRPRTAAVVSGALSIGVAS